MRFLADHDVYLITVRHIRALGHDIVRTVDVGLSAESDIDVLAFTCGNDRVLITRDRDFGLLVFSEKQRGGVVYLRMSPSTIESVHAELSVVVSKHDESEMIRSFIVVEPGRHRIRKLPS